MPTAGSGESTFLTGSQFINVWFWLISWAEDLWHHHGQKFDCEMKCHQIVFWRGASCWVQTLPACSAEGWSSGEFKLSRSWSLPTWSKWKKLIEYQAKCEAEGRPPGGNILSKIWPQVTKITNCQAIYPAERQLSGRNVWKLIRAQVMKLTKYYQKWPS